MKKAKKVTLGFVAVDSGQLIITDPAYISSFDSESELPDDLHGPDRSYSYKGCCAATVEDHGDG